MKIGMLHRSNLAEVRSLSGVPYFMAKALQEHVGDVAYISLEDSFLTKAIEFTAKVLNRLSYATLRRHIATDHHRILSKQLGRAFGPRVQLSGCDVLFAPVASVEIAYLSTSIPIIYYSDLNWFDIVDYYPGCSSLFEFSRIEGEIIDAAALSKSSALIYPSEWAAKTAIEHYNVASHRVTLAPCGANFEPADVPAREDALNHSLEGETVLLWIGVDWQRKGGSIAYDCLTALLDRKVDAKLVVCGCIPPERFSHPKIEVIPFLSKSNPEQRRRLSQLFLEATFFLFPTMAEAYGIVLCEASAHGLPSLVRDTGGVGGAIKDGENGFLMAPEAQGKQYAQKILEILQNPSAYEALVRSSRAVYEDKLNWDAWGRTVKPIFEQVAQGERL
jgi:glycosyltransferase involved in cell wall biosynthesis